MVTETTSRYYSPTCLCSQINFLNLNLCSQINFLNLNGMLLNARDAVFEQQRLSGMIPFLMYAKCLRCSIFN